MIEEPKELEEMTVETFEDMTTAFSDMFDMEMPEDLQQKQ